MIHNKKFSMAVSLFAAVFILIACGKKPSAQKEEAPAPATETQTETAPAAPAAGVGSIKGKVSFTGTVPTAAALNRQSDPFCAKTEMKDPSVIVNANNTLQNVAVRVVGAKGGAEPSSTVQVGQENCMYTPRVQTGFYDKEIEILNHDPTLHNVHTYSGSKTLFNRAQPKGSPSIKHTFTTSDGEIIKFKCDVHPWMTGWLINNDSGFAAVTGEAGEFEIKDVPAGTYTLKSFHESYGEKEVQVTVEADKASTADFSYDGTEKAAFKFHEVHLSMAH